MPTKNGARMMALETRRIERQRVRGIQEFGHQLRHAAGRQLAVALARQYQMPMPPESLRETLGVGAAA